ncbi:MAG TPA: hypothetical protein VK478_03545 [Gemmatimonadaceae bacterium]|nr:hypothetical protein [Gemmatimonadaceae bacterium]
MAVSASGTFSATGEVVGAGGVGAGIFGAGVVTIAGVAGALAATDGQR